MGLCPLPNMGTNAQDGATAAGSQGGGLLGWFKGLLKGKDKDKVASPLKGNSRKRIVADPGSPASQVRTYTCALAKRTVMKCGTTLRYVLVTRAPGRCWHRPRLTTQQSSAGNSIVLFYYLECVQLLCEGAHNAVISE